jgi:hypothetical protein
MLLKTIRPHLTDPNSPYWSILQRRLDNLYLHKTKQHKEIVQQALLILHSEVDHLDWFLWDLHSSQALGVLWKLAKRIVYKKSNSPLIYGMSSDQSEQLFTIRGDRELLYRAVQIALPISWRPIIIKRFCLEKTIKRDKLTPISALSKQFNMSKEKINNIINWSISKLSDYFNDI